MLRPLARLNIKKLEHLALQLQVKEKDLLRLAESHQKNYRENEFVDKKGKTRRGLVPTPRFRPVADRINKLLQRVMLPESLHGGRPKHSTVTNAMKHVGKALLINLDIKSFYPSIRPRMVYEAFTAHCGCSPDVARLLTRLVTVNGELPQGSPPSSIISAMVAVPMARRLELLASLHRADYTQYVDDITISGPAHLSKLVPLIEEIVRTSGFTPHPQKKAVLGRFDEQVVTGLRVNVHLDAPRGMYDAIADALQELEGKPSGMTGAGSEIATLRGRIEYVRQFNRAAARLFEKRLDRVAQAGDGLQK